MRRHAIAAALFIITILVYLPAASYSFIGYDDYEYVVDNRHVQRGITPQNFLWAFKLGPGHCANWHPLTLLSHMLDVQLFGLRGGAHHFVNTAIHAAAAVTLFAAMLRMTGAMWRSAIVAALFAWHPLHVQSVAWISERKDVLSALFCFLSTYAYARYAELPKLARYLLVAALFAAALLAKPTAVVWPLVLLLLDYWPLKRSASWKRLALEKLPLLAMSAAASALTVLAQRSDHAVSTLISWSVSARLENAVVAYVVYLYKTIAPVQLAVFYPLRYWEAWQVAGAAAILIVISAYAIRAAHRRPYVIVGWLWYVGALVPMIGIIQVGAQSMADRYTYLPLIGIFIAVVWTAGDSLPPRVGAWIAGIILGLTLLGTSIQLRYWRDSLALHSRALEVTQDNWLAHGYVGWALSATDPDAALRHYNIATTLNPDYHEVQYSLANMLLRAHRLDEAITHYRRAVKSKPNFARGYLNLGVALAQTGDAASAQECFARAAQLFHEQDDPAEQDAEKNLRLLRDRAKR